MAAETIPTQEEVDPNPWEIVRHDSENGVAIRCIGGAAVNLCDLGVLRHQTNDFLASVGIDEEWIGATESVLAEFMQNGVRHSPDQRVLEVDVIVGTEEGDIDIAVANNISPDAINPDGTLRGMEFRGQDGKILPATDDPECLFAEHGYGLRAIVDDITKGRWGYEVDQREMRVVTYAVVRRLGEASLKGEEYKTAA